MIEPPTVTDGKAAITVANASFGMREEFITISIVYEADLASQEGVGSQIDFQGIPLGKDEMITDPKKVSFDGIVEQGPKRFASQSNSVVHYIPIIQNQRLAGQAFKNRANDCGTEGRARRIYGIVRQSFQPNALEYSIRNPGKKEIRDTQA
ncbi:MAG: hypothetical protein CVU57_12865 [Deltaproteobacteria bacterium HGW-Deltaproteobacteria-15]|nr:MAG: hypothetical protein CVU57_12865 [Deltaproteobacteria bacterium HGW-Deltaproteobacteria-15]